MANNYDIAYTTLVERYQNKRLLANSCWQSIYNASKLNSESASCLRKLLDIFCDNLAALKNLGLPVDSWDFILFHLLIQKLDLSTIKRFEMQDPSTDLPSYQRLNIFLQKQCTALESVSLSVSSKTFTSHNSKIKSVSPQSRNEPFVRPRSFVANSTSFNGQPMYCIFCKAPHKIYNCPSFVEKTPQERLNIAKTNRWCTNCLHSAHNVSNCSSSFTCRHCNAKHHSLLHIFHESVSSKNSPSQSIHPSNSHVVKNISLQHTQTPFSQNTQNSQLSHPSISNLQGNISRGGSENSPSFSIQSTSGKVTSSQALTLTNVLPSRSTVLLSTAIVEVRDCDGHFQSVRALLDSASEVSVISQSCLQRLGLKSISCSLSIYGLGQNSSSSSSGVTCLIRPKGQSLPTFEVDTVVLPRICSNLPNSYVPIDTWTHLSGLKLADPTFNVPGSIDLLLGADIFPLLLLGDYIKGSQCLPTALNTIFGWVLIGKTPDQSISTSVSNSLCASLGSSLDTILKRFWEVEEVPKVTVLSPEDQKCEQIFADNHFRKPCGRYSVALPFRADPEPIFSDSRAIAMRRLLSLERRLFRDTMLHKAYSEFMQDYLDQGHMELVVQNSSPSSKIYYIPHHCVFNPSSLTTKLRVVFDASSKTSDNVSLNDCLLIGPKLQADIMSVLLNFRLHSIVFTADIKQMYRQIEINSEHQDYQRILWRFSPTDPVQDFRLKTVTYGVSSSPYLAIKTILQLADDEGNNFPLAAKILRSDMYVDDVVTGCSNLTAAVDAKFQLTSLLHRGGFELRKWASNSSEFLQTIPESLRVQQSLGFDHDENTIKVLGLKWSPIHDAFLFSADSILTLNQPCTKRSMLSVLARIFDPLGFLSPLTFFAKYLIQYLWVLGCDWDDQPTADVITRWNLFISQLSSLSQLQIPRYLTLSNYVSCQLHGFADSSEKGYAAVVYIRLEISEERYNIFLITAKSKVAPLKRISLPRLELCAAVLLADLMSMVTKNYHDKLSFSKMYAWTDSSVALSWIKSSPHRWKSFVSNRVSRIQEKVSPNRWFHVPSAKNPADCASRGLLPNDLINHSLWWEAAPFLHMPERLWPTNSNLSVDFSAFHEEERKLTLSNFVSLTCLDSLLENFSSLAKIKRIVAYSLRFLYNIKHPDRKILGALNSQEVHNAMLVLVKHVQHTVFSDVIIKLQSNKRIPKNLRKLSIFLAEDGVLRVGGRLTNSGLSYDQKFPALLPQKHRFVNLLIEDVHRQHLHPGLQTVHFLLVQNFWILSPKRAIRHCLSKCIRCFKTKPSSLQPPMGNLPAVRVNQVKPFQVVGVDFGGPFRITLGKSRGIKSQKAYLCLFVCFATKAVHLELASDLTSDCFLAALRRFISRRGRCSQIFSDCGTNFVGAKREICQLMKDATESELIQWSFNPPSSPHFGGLWESGIKSAKSHLIRVIGEQVLTFEEMYTVLVQIEAVLNSRPMYPLSSDPNDFSVLTPGHFLTLEPLTSLPDHDLSHLNLNSLSRWQLVQRLQRDIWKRWHTEYLNTLQQKSKWLTNSIDIPLGTLVLIKNSLTPPLRWQLGRIERLHPGTDNVSRVASVRTSSGLIQRPLVKLCPLPV